MNKKVIGFIFFIIFFANIFFLPLLLNAAEKADKDKTITRRFSIIVRGGLAAKTGRALDPGLGSQLALNFLTPSRLWAHEAVVGIYYFPTKYYSEADMALKMAYHLYHYVQKKRNIRSFFYGGFGIYAGNYCNTPYGITLGAGYEINFSSHLVLEASLNFNVTLGEEAHFLASALLGLKYRIF
jgi:hypothetical protein